MEKNWIPIIEKRFEIKIHPCETKREQYDIGENYEGYEFKYDKNYDGPIRCTGNLFIEIAEKSHPDNEKWIASGIFRQDNTIFYCIGNLKILFIYEKEFLINFFNQKKRNVIFGYDDKKRRRSKGFLLIDPKPFMKEAYIIKNRDQRRLRSGEN